MQASNSLEAHPINTSHKGTSFQTRTSSLTISVPPTPAVAAETAPASGGGISTPAVIGIGIGSAVAALVVVSLIGLLFFIHWRRKKKPLPAAPHTDAPPVPPKEWAGSPVPYRAVSPLYELPEEASPQRPSTTFSSKRDMAPSPGSAASLLFMRGKGRRESGVLAYNPVELDASEASLRDRASPASDFSGWTDRQGRGGTMPMPWA